MIAPMPLTTYEEVRPWARAVAKKVQSREMPPWFASPEFHGVFSNERTLTDAQIETVVSWARSGAPKGDPADAPPAPSNDHMVDGWSIGKPDLVVDLAEPFWIDDDVRDLNISLKAKMITEAMLPEARWIEAIEFKPGSDAVHHIIASTRAADAEAPAQPACSAGSLLEPSRLLCQGFWSSADARLADLPPDALQQRAWRRLGSLDRSQIAFKFKPKDEKVEHVAVWEAIGNRDFEIPPNVENWKVGASMIFEREATLFALLPHMHLRGKYAKYVAYYPNGTEETLLEVPWYDWNWQTNYEFKEPKVIPAGTRVEVTMFFDNTKEREELIRAGGSEINSNRAVRFGGPTYDEMMLGFVDYAYTGPETSVTQPVPTAAGGE